MPFPFLIGAAVIGAGLAGIGGHLSAKETNEKAQKIANEAKEKFEKAKANLETKQADVNECFSNYLDNKKDVLNTVMKRFFDSYNYIKSFNLKSSTGIAEIDQMEFGLSQLEELKNLAHVYNQANTDIDSSNAALFLGAAAGPVAAATFASGGILAATLTSPLAIIGAPVFLFSAFKADEKAHENLDKAETFAKETEVTVSKINANVKLCKAIIEKVNLYDELLDQFHEVFVGYEKEMTKVIQSALKKSSDHKISPEMFTEADLSLFAVTRNIAKAVKLIIDTPIIDKDWHLTKDSEENYIASQQLLEHVVEDKQ